MWDFFSCIITTPSPLERPEVTIWQQLCRTTVPRRTAGASTALRGGRVALERVKKGPGAKDCPRCGSAIEKTEGCTTTHDMACPGCKCHICWKCLDTSDTSKLCYNHLTVRHGWWVLLTVDARLLQ
uniref:IBR domain-containing protein n=1 Tax=Pyricularia oryzae (strain P131) TaxID=1143193 RepID=L7JBB5_PYRO1